jgi:exonuclease SbcC
MIKAIELINFQSHKKSLLKFHPGVNAIIGPSDAGKTAILRALWWAVFNRPLGDEFKSWWGGDTSVRLFLGQDDNHMQSITRIKTGPLNQYKLGHEIFNAVRADIPEEIQKVLNMNETNLQQQLDRPFLLDASPGEVGAHFNRIAHLDEIDKGNNNVQRWIRDILEDISADENLLKRLNEEIKQYDHLASVENDLQVIEQMEIQAANNKRAMYDLSDTIVAIREIDIGIDTLTKKTVVAFDIEQTLALMQNNNRLIEKGKTLSSLIIAYQEMVYKLLKYDKIVANEQDVTAGLELYDKHKNKMLAIRTLSHLVEQIEKTTTLLVTKEKEKQQFMKKFDDEFPDICPLCGKPK